MTTTDRDTNVDGFQFGNLLFVAALLTASYLLLANTTQSGWWTALCLLISAGYAFNWLCSNNGGNKFIGVVAAAATVWLIAMFFGFGPHPLSGTYYSAQMGSLTFLRSGRVISQLTGPSIPGVMSVGSATTCSGTYSVDGQSVDISPCSDLKDKPGAQGNAIASMMVDAMDMQGSLTADRRTVIVNDVRFDKQ